VSRSVSGCNSTFSNVVRERSPRRGGEACASRASFRLHCREHLLARVHFSRRCAAEQSSTARGWGSSPLSPAYSIGSPGSPSSSLSRPRRPQLTMQTQAYVLAGASASNPPRAQRLLADLPTFPASSPRPAETNAAFTLQDITVRAALHVLDAQLLMHASRSYLNPKPTRCSSRSSLAGASARLSLLAMEPQLFVRAFELTLIHLQHLPHRPVRPERRLPLAVPERRGPRDVRNRRQDGLGRQARPGGRQGAVLVQLLRKLSAVQGALSLSRSRSPFVADSRLLLFPSLLSPSPPPPSRPSTRPPPLPRYLLRSTYDPHGLAERPSCSLRGVRAHQLWSSAQHRPRKQARHPRRRRRGDLRRLLRAEWVRSSRRRRRELGRQGGRRRRPQDARTARLWLPDWVRSSLSTICLSCRPELHD